MDFICTVFDKFIVRESVEQRVQLTKIDHTCIHLHSYTNKQAQAHPPTLAFIETESVSEKLLYSSVYIVYKTESDFCITNLTRTIFVCSYEN